MLPWDTNKKSICSFRACSHWNKTIKTYLRCSNNELKRHLSLYGTIIGITSTWVHVCWHAKQRHTLSYGLKLKLPGPVVCFVISCHPVNDTVVKDKMQQLLTLPLLSSRLIKRWRRRNRIRQPFICFIGFILRIYRNLSGNTTWYRVSTLLIWLYGLKEYYKKKFNKPLSNNSIAIKMWP